MSTPLDQLHALGMAKGIDFLELLHQELEHGWVFSGPTFFVMGHPVCSTGTWGTKDTWLITGVAGDMAEAWQHLPYELPYVQFQRGDGVLRSYPLRALRRLCKGVTS